MMKSQTKTEILPTPAAFLLCEHHTALLGMLPYTICMQGLPHSPYTYPQAKTEVFLGNAMVHPLVCSEGCSTPWPGKQKPV